MSTHALIESVANDVMAFPCNRVRSQEVNKTDTSIMMVAARDIVGANISARGEILFAPADVKTTYNRHIITAADMLDSPLRVSNAVAQDGAKGQTATVCAPGGGKGNRDPV